MRWKKQALIQNGDRGPFAHAEQRAYSTLYGLAKMN